MLLSVATSSRAGAIMWSWGMMRDPDEALMVGVRPLVLFPVTQVEGNQMLMGWLKLSGARDPLLTHRLHS